MPRPAVENIRAWVAARDPAGPANLRLDVARQATHAVGVLGEGLELAGAAFSFSVMVRVYEDIVSNLSPNTKTDQILINFLSKSPTFLVGTETIFIGALT